MCTCVYIYMYAVQRRAIVMVIDAHHKDLDVNALASDLKNMGIFTTEQCQKLTSLVEKDRRHEALLYSLLVHKEPDMYHRLIKCIGLRNTSIAAGLQGMLAYIHSKLSIVFNVGIQGKGITIFHLSNAATFMDLMKPPGALSVGSSQSMLNYICI